jgi:hypothetical protein
VTFRFCRRWRLLATALLDALAPWVSVVIYWRPTRRREGTGPSRTVNGRGRPV